MYNLPQTLPIFCLSLLVACSTTKHDFIYENGEKAAKVAARQTASFEDYRQWRKSHDPSGETYAEYEAWEVAYRQWLKSQKPDLNQNP